MLLPGSPLIRRVQSAEAVVHWCEDLHVAARVEPEAFRDVDARDVDGQGGDPPHGGQLWLPYVAKLVTSTVPGQKRYGDAPLHVRRRRRQFFLSSTPAGDVDLVVLRLVVITLGA